MMKDSNQPLLIVEDSDADFEALRRLMRLLLFYCLKKRLVEAIAVKRFS